MNDTPTSIENLRKSIPSTVIISADPTPLSETLSAYEDGGFESTDWLVRFFDQYEGLTFDWPFRDRRANFATTVERCFDSPDSLPRHVQIFSRRIGIEVLPVGAAFSTEDSLLLAENGDFLFGSDAGIQWIAHGFEETVRTLVTGDWDMTYHPIAAGEENLLELMTKPSGH